MTKKDYRAVARVIFETREFTGKFDGDPEPVLREVTERLAEVYAADNPRFDRARFVEACETGRCKGMSR